MAVFSVASRLVTALWSLLLISKVHSSGMSISWWLSHSSWSLNQADPLKHSLLTDSSTRGRPCDSRLAGFSCPEQCFQQSTGVIFHCHGHGFRQTASTLYWHRQSSRELPLNLCNRFLGSSLAQPLRHLKWMSSIWRAAIQRVALTVAWSISRLMQLRFWTRQTSQTGPCSSPSPRLLVHKLF